MTEVKMMQFLIETAILYYVTLTWGYTICNREEGKKTTLIEVGNALIKTKLIRFISIDEALDIKIGCGEILLPSFEERKKRNYGSGKTKK